MLTLSLLNISVHCRGYQQHIKIISKVKCFCGVVALAIFYLVAYLGTVVKMEVKHNKIR